jgi:hypothetical protein
MQQYENAMARAVSMRNEAEANLKRVMGQMSNGSLVMYEKAKRLATENVEVAKGYMNKVQYVFTKQMEKLGGLLHIDLSATIITIIINMIITSITIVITTINTIITIITTINTIITIITIIITTINRIINIITIIIATINTIITIIITIIIMMTTTIIINNTIIIIMKLFRYLTT